MTPNEWRCGLCMLSTCGSDLPDNSNDFSIVHWLSMVTSSRIATASWPSKYLKKNVKFKTVDLSLTESFLFFFLFFLQVQQQKSQLHAYIFMQAKLHSMLKDSHYAITLKAEVTKNYTSMILYNYFFVYPICCSFYHGFAHVFKRWLLYVFFARHQRDTG